MGIRAAFAVPHPPLIVPAVGRGQERAIQDTIESYQDCARRIVEINPDVLIVTSPHAPLFRDAFHITDSDRLSGSMSQFNAPEESLDVSNDVELAHKIMAVAKGYNIPVIGCDYYTESMDHATYVPLYFVREAYRASGRPASQHVSSSVPCRLVRIGLSGLSQELHQMLGRCIKQAIDELGREAVFIASGDLSHKLKPDGPYGFAPEGPVFDEQIGALFQSGQLSELFTFDPTLVEAAAECGLRSFQIMAGALEGLPFTSKLLSNEGPFGVGYGVASFEVKEPAFSSPDSSYDATCTPQPSSTEAVTEKTNDVSLAHKSGKGASAKTDEGGNLTDPYVELARLSVETYIQTGQAAALPASLPFELTENQAGVFVSLHKGSDLRGCIGTISATQESIAEEIIANGIAAASRDPRFSAVRPDELDYLSYSVDVLEQAEPVFSVDELDPYRYGVIVTQGFKRGLLLPNLDGIDTVEMQIAIAKQKAGISTYDTDVRLERFEVIRHERGGEARKR